jgi:hypothetical protein
MGDQTNLGAGCQLVALGLRDAVLADFVEQGFVADLEQCGCLLAVPVGLVKRLPDRFRFGFILGAARYGF